MTEDKRPLTVGIIGGMGPAATLDLFKKILAFTPASCDEEHLNLQIDGNPVPGARREPLCERAKRLEACGVDFIVMPCNAAHAHYDAIQTSVSIPVVNMIRATVKTIKKSDPRIKEVGVLAWHETLTAGLYQKMLMQYELRPVIPESSQWVFINELVNAVKSGMDITAQKNTVIGIGQTLISRGAQAIVLGCTELPLALNQNDFPVPVIDATGILAKAAVDLAFSQAKFEDF